MLTQLLYLGPPPQKPHTSYGPPKPHFSVPKPVYGLPIKPPVNFKPQTQYGPPQPQIPIRQPVPIYGPPTLQQPQQQQLQSVQSLPSLPNIQRPIHGAGCDGWKPIPGPSVGTQALANSNQASINAFAPENTYLPPASNNFPSAPANNFPVNDVNLQVQPLPNNLQLPIAEPYNFNNNHADLGANLASGLGLTSINVVKSEGIEVSSK